MTVVAAIDTQALQHNLALVKTLAPQAKVLAMVKANAYGHGLVQVANALADADAVAAARLDEALALREAYPERRVVVLSEYCSSDLLQQCASYAFDLVLHQIEDVAAFCREHLPVAINIWLKLDTGMHRLGLPCSDAEKVHQVIKQITDNRNARELVLMSHFASAEADYTNTEGQIRRFAELTNEINCERSLANSAAIMRWPASHVDWVRPGIMLYGASPFINDKTNSDLQPVMTLTAPVIAVNHIKAGERVGYNGIWQAQRDSSIGTVGIGYGDGYPRHARNGTPVLLNGVRAPMVGRVSMDMITVDLTDHPRYAVGDSVVLWGKDLLANEVASFADTIAYDLFTSVSKRVNFCYET
ncbi:MAG: alanine racemase [Pseudomonadales bacterium]